MRVLFIFKTNICALYKFFNLEKLDLGLTKKYTDTEILI